MHVQFVYNFSIYSSEYIMIIDYYDICTIIVVLFLYNTFTQTRKLQIYKKLQYKKF